MSDRGRRSAREHIRRDDLERNLKDLGSWAEYPPAPDLARAVRQRLEEDTESTGERSVGHSPSHRRSFSPRWAVAVVALVLVVSLPLLSQGVRDTLSGAFVGAGSAGNAASGGAAPGGAASEGAGGQSVRGASGDASTSDDRDEKQGGVTASGSASAASSEGDEAVTGASREFGDPLTLKQARERLDGRLLLPNARTLGEPVEVYELGRVQTKTQTTGIAIVYLQRPGLPSLGGTGAGLVLVEIPSDLRSMYPDGDLVEGSGSEEVGVGDGRGYWITERDKFPPPLDVSVHPRSNVLVWERGGLVIRLETELPREEAVQLAESVR